MLTVRQIFDDLLGTLGVDNPDTSSASLRTSVLGYIQAGLQLMQLAGEDFYCSEEEAVALLAGTGAYELDSDVQTVLAPVLLANGQPLRQITSRAQWQDFGPLFYGQASRTVPNGTPIAYFVEATKAEALTTAAPTGNIVVSGAGSSSANGTYFPIADLNGKSRWVNSTTPTCILFYDPSWLTGSWRITAGGNPNYESVSTESSPAGLTFVTNGGTAPAPAVTAELSTPTGEDDPAKITIHVLPVPSATGTLTVPVIKEPPTYTADDLCGTSPTPPVPHKYHETILLPLCRMNVTTNPSFARHKDKLPQIEADFIRALTVLGIADPRRPKQNRNNAAALQATASTAGGQQQ